MNDRIRLPAVIIGIFIILAGLSIIFNISIHIFKIIIGLIFIYLGMTVIFKRNILQFKKSSLMMCGKYNMMLNEKTLREYSVMFSSAVFEFNEFILNENKEIHITVLFGRAKIKIKKELPVKVIAATGFGRSTDPDGHINNFGEIIYSTNSYDESKPHLILNCEVLFADLIIE